MNFKKIIITIIFASLAGGIFGTYYAQSQNFTGNPFLKKTGDYIDLIRSNWEWGDPNNRKDANFDEVDANSSVITNLDTSGCAKFGGSNTSTICGEGTTSVIGAGLTVSGTTNLATTTVDATGPEALLVRKDGDSGDVFSVDTNNSSVGINTMPDSAVSLDVDGEWQYEVSDQNQNGMLFGVSSTDLPTIGPIIAGSQVSGSQIRYNNNTGRWEVEAPLRSLSGLVLDDDEDFSVGTRSDYQMRYDSGNTQFEFENTNDNNIFTVQDGSQDVEFQGDIGLGVTPTGNNGQIVVDDNTDNSATAVNSYDGGVQISNSSQADGSYSLFKFNHGVSPDADGAYIKSSRVDNNQTTMELGQYDNGGNVAGTPYITMDENYNVDVPNGDLSVGAGHTVSTTASGDGDKFLSLNSSNNSELAFYQDATGGGDFSIERDGTRYIRFASDITYYDQPLVVDQSNTDSLLVRKNGNTGDIFRADTSNAEVTVGSGSQNADLTVNGNAKISAGNRLITEATADDDKLISWTTSQNDEFFVDQREIGGNKSIAWNSPAGEMFILRNNGSFFWQEPILADLDSTAALEFRGDAAGPTALLVDTTNQQVSIGNGNPSNELTVSGDQDITGNLGIGTSSPSTALDVNGKGSFNDDHTFYGEMTTSSNSTATTISSQNSFTEINVLEAGVTRDITFSNSNLTINTTGTYKLEGSFTLQSGGSDSDTYNIGVFVNGSQIADQKFVCKTAVPNTGADSCSSQVGVPLNSGDIVDVRIENESDASDVTVQQANVYLSQQ